jgi:uncharacterized protein YbjT (DUF2867 family)
MAEMEKAMVFGATGFTGREVVAELCRRGIPAVAHVRPDSPRLKDWREKFMSMGAEVDTSEWEEAALVRTFVRVKPAIIFCAIGTTRARIKQAVRSGRDPKRQDYEAVDYGLTALLLRAASAAGIKPRFVYLSAAGTGKTGLTAYARARYKAEQAVLKSGLPYTIARPSFIVGPDRDDKRSMELLGAKMIDGLLLLAGVFGLRKLRERYRSTTNRVLARALVRYAFEPSAENAILESETLH